MEPVQLEIAIFSEGEHVQCSVFADSFSIGSAECDRPNHFVVDDPLVAPLQLSAGLTEDGESLRIRNFERSLVLDDGFRIHPGISRELPIPLMLAMGDSRVQVCLSNFESQIDRTLQPLEALSTHCAQESISRDHQPPSSSENGISPSPETLVSWFDALGQMQRSTAGHGEFFKLAARCVFNPGGMDGCIILRRSEDAWSIVSQHLPYPEAGISYRRDLVEMAAERKSAIFHHTTSEAARSDHDLHSAAVCPVVDHRGEVVGMVYGFRSCLRSNSRNGIRPLEARFVALIADAVAAGLIRLEQEADGARKRVLLQQAFSSEVASKLEDNPDILVGTEREVSVLFADLRDFCRISESIGANLTYQLLTDVMDRFTQIIHEHQGVVIDFFGDGISAFWNAPVDQPDHPVLACQAALAIDDAMAHINASWSREIGCRLRAGIGVHTGSALVGNSGSRNRLKYGPQGTTVNIASRLEQATKQVGEPILISGETADRVDGILLSQRVCSSQLSGIRSATDLHCLIHSRKFSQCSSFYIGYQNALTEFDSGNYAEAIELLTQLSSEFESEPLIEFLIKEAVARVSQEFGSASAERSPVAINKSDLLRTTKGTASGQSSGKSSSVASSE